MDAAAPFQPGTPALGGPGAGSQQALRSSNTRRLMEALTVQGPLTQAELSRITGLSAATVSNIVRSLCADGVVATSPTTSSGRRAHLVQLTASGGGASGLVAGVDFGRRHVRVVLASVGRRVLAEELIDLPRGRPAAESIAAANSLLGGLLAEAQVDRSELMGCGVAVPGPIDARTGLVAHSVILPEWSGFRPIDHLREAFGVPVFLDNDANLGALGEITWGPYADVTDLIYVKVASGIGAGLVLGGRLHRGAVGITGEIGHLPVNAQGGVCVCGNRGCLETVASTTTMLEGLAQAGVLEPGAPTAGLVRLMAAANPTAMRVVEGAGLALGQALGGLSNVLNPSTILIGGPLVPLGETFLEPVRRGLARYSVTGHSTLRMASLGDRAEVLGACSLVSAALAQERLPTAS